MITELKVYDAIKPKLGEEEAKMLLELIETKVDSEATRELVTTAALNQTESRMTAALNQVESRMESKMTAVLSQVESRIIWKLLAISGGQLAILLAILKLFAT